MNKILTIITGLMLLNLFGCKESKEDKAFKTYNEGVSFSIDAGRYMEDGNEAEGKKTYEISTQKFKETLEINPNHKGAAGAIGFNNYEIRNYDEALNWFNQAIKVEPEFAVNHQFLGLSQINKGQVEEGRMSIDKAFELDSSEEMKSHTIENLVDIGNLAYLYGEVYEKEGKMEEGKGYRLFGIRVLMMAFEYNNKDEEIGNMIEKYTKEVNDETLENWIKEKMR